MSSGLFNEIQSNLKNLEDINDHLNVHHGSILNNGAILFLRLVYIFEDQYEWRDNHIINDKQSDPEIPHIAECALSVDEVPFQPVFVLADLVILVYIFIDIVYHHLLKVGFSHFL